MLIQSQLRAVVTREMHFQKVVFLFQQVFHIVFPNAELVVGKKEFFAVQIHFGVGVNAFKLQFNILFFKQILVRIETQGVVPRMV